MKKILSVFVTFLVSVTILLVLYITMNRSPVKSTQPLNNIPTPIVITVVRELSDLSKFLEDEAEVFIVIEWDTSCPYCKQELLYLETVWTETIQVIGLNPYNDPIEQLMYADENELSFTLVIGRTDRSFLGVPFTQVYSRDGTMLGQFFGWDKDNGPAQLAEILKRGFE